MNWVSSLWWDLLIARVHVIDIYTSASTFLNLFHNLMGAINTLYVVDNVHIDNETLSLA